MPKDSEKAQRHRARPAHSGRPREAGRRVGPDREPRGGRGATSVSGEVARPSLPPWWGRRRHRRLEGNRLAPCRLCASHGKTELPCAASRGQAHSRASGAVVGDLSAQQAWPALARGLVTQTAQAPGKGANLVLVCPQVPGEGQLGLSAVLTEGQRRALWQSRDRAPARWELKAEAAAAHQSPGLLRLLRAPRGEPPWAWRKGRPLGHAPASAGPAGGLR